MQEGRRAQIVPARTGKIVIFGIAAAVLLADQATKAWAVAALSGGRRIPVIGSVLDFRLVMNPGSAFGLFKGWTLAIFVVSSLITALVVGWALRDPAASPVLGLIIGGGLGNLVDRVVRPPGPGRGEVVDFIYLSFWPTFNLADSAIVVGVGLLLMMSVREQAS
ncbi:MAG: signal peptidase II [Actinomycetota bacterium]